MTWCRFRAYADVLHGEAAERIAAQGRRVQRRCSQRSGFREPQALSCLAMAGPPIRYRGHDEHGSR